MVDLRGVEFPVWQAREAADGSAVFYRRTPSKALSGDGGTYSARTVATLVLCANVAGDLEESSSITTADGKPYSTFTPTFAAGVIHFDDRTRSLFPWPTPEWRSPADWEAFGAVWQRALEQLGASPSADEAAQWFLRAAAAVGLASRSAKLPQVELPEGKQAWSRTFELLAQCAAAAPDTARGRAIARWAIFEAPLLCSPESGLSANGANDLLHRWGLLWQEKFNLPLVFDALRQLREFRARRVWPQANFDVSSQLRRIDQQRRSYQWSFVVLGPEERRVREVRDWLSKLQMPKRSDTVATVAEELGLLSTLAASDDRADAGRLDAAMALELPKGLSASLAAIWRAMVMHASWRGAHADV